MSAYVDAVRALVIAEDPWGYIRDMGAPDDEYDDCVMALTKWREPVGVEQVRAAFGDISDAVAARLASGIEALRTAR